MNIQDYISILDAIPMTGIYVIREDDHEILYFNKRVKEVAPNIQIGMICHEIWAGTCDKEDVKARFPMKRAPGPSVWNSLRKAAVSMKRMWRDFGNLLTGSICGKTCAGGKSSLSAHTGEGPGAAFAGIRLR